MRPSVQLAVVGLLAVLTSAPSAFAQRARTIDSLVSRPGTRGASTLIGGAYTSSSQVQMLAATRRDVNLLGQDRFLYMRPRGGHGGSSALLPVSQAGLFSPLSGPRGLSLSAMMDRSGDAALISGLAARLNLRLPIPTRGAGGLPALNAFVYTPRPKTSAFERFFDLNPQTAPDAGNQPAIRTIAEELEKQTDETVERALRDGLTLFKAATIERRDALLGQYPNCRDCADDLFRAQQKLQLVRDLDHDSALSCLLLAHVALEQERPTLASSYLIEAYGRDPELLSVNAAAIDEYFGDAAENGGHSAVLEAQMRRYVQLGEFNSHSVMAQLQSAYCAWRLSDPARAAAFAQQAETLARAAAEPYPEAISFADAIRNTSP